MRKGMKKYLILLASMLFLLLPMTVSATEETGDIITTGTFGDNNGFEWSYNETTKTLTITGEDSGFEGTYDEELEIMLSPLGYISDDIEKIILKDCKVIGSMDYAFCSMYFLNAIEFEHFDTSEVTSMYGMFAVCPVLEQLDVSSFDTSNVTTMSGMFVDCEALKSLDLSNFNTSKVTDMSGMFDWCFALETLDISSFDTSNVTNMWLMFERCEALKELDLSHFNTSQVTNMSGMFTECTSLEKLDVSSFDTSNVTNMSGMFYLTEVLENLDVTGFDTSKVTDMSAMFCGMYNLKSLDVTGFDTSEVTNMTYMFGYCGVEEPIDLSSFDTTNVTDMEGMFECVSWESIDLSVLESDSVTCISGMFAFCENLKEVNWGSFDTSKVTDMSYLFYTTGMEYIDLSMLDTSSVENMRYMFGECNSLVGVDMSSFDMSQVTNVKDMFTESSSLKSIRTPKVMTENTTITLPVTFYDSEGTETTVLTADYCNDVLSTELPPTEYYVEHYLMNLDGETYELEEKVTVDFEGKSYDKVTGELKTYEGFTAPEVQSLVMVPGGETTIQYYYTRNKYALTVNAPDYIDATGTTASGEYFYGATISVNAAINYTPAEAYILEGWSYNGEEKTLPGSFTMPAENVNIEFISSVKEYTIQFDANGGNGTVAQSEAIEYFEDYTLPTGGFTYDGYVLLGWSILAQEPSEEVDCDYCLGETVKELTTEDSITLYAVWSPYPSVEVTAEHTEMIIGNAMQLGITVDDEVLDAEAMGDYVWSVDSEDVVSVSEDGKVTALGVGKAIITCLNKENEYMSDTFEVAIRIPFTDIALSDWQYPYVVYVYENNIMAGKDGNFDMNGEITRSEFVTVLYNYNKKPAVTYAQDFSDVTQADWFAKPITWAKQNNITAGYADGRFGVYDSITREQLVVMLYKYAKATGVVTEDVTVDLSDFADAEDVTSWAQKALTWATQNNIITGKNANGVKNIAPQDSTTRGECATMIKKYIALIEE